MLNFIIGPSREPHRGRAICICFKLMFAMCCGVWALSHVQWDPVLFTHSRLHVFFSHWCSSLEGLCLRRPMPVPTSPIQVMLPEYFNTINNRLYGISWEPFLSNLRRICQIFVGSLSNMFRICVGFVSNMLNTCRPMCRLFAESVKYFWRSFAESLSNMTNLVECVVYVPNMQNLRRFFFESLSNTSHLCRVFVDYVKYSLNTCRKQKNY